MSFRFERKDFFSCTVEELFEYHEADGALQRLTPPWESAKLLKKEGEGIKTGAKIFLKVKVPFFQMGWVSEHTEYDYPHMFKDVMIKGPFKKWEHTHIFREEDGGASLTDIIEYQPPFKIFGRLGKKFIEAKLDSMFAYRHRITKYDIQSRKNKKSGKISITGSGGLIGQKLKPYLSVLGYDVSALNRGENNGEHFWDYKKQTYNNIEDIDIFIHLAGEPIGDNRWTPARKKRIYESRIEGTRFLVDKILEMKKRPKIFICASAVGFYGNRGDEVLTEKSSQGDDYISTVCSDWEKEAKRLENVGVRVVYMRIGVVLSPEAGALFKFILPFKFGLGGYMGCGSHYMSWVSIEDVLGSFEHVIKNDIYGAVNITSPEPATHRSFAETLGKVLHRPSFIKIPAFSISWVFGQMGRELLLSSTKAVPEVLEESGYVFRHKSLESAMKKLMGIEN